MTFPTFQTRFPKITIIKLIRTQVKIIKITFVSTVNLWL